MADQKYPLMETIDGLGKYTLLVLGFLYLLKLVFSFGFSFSF